MKSETLEHFYIDTGMGLILILKSNVPKKLLCTASVECSWCPVCCVSTGGTWPKKPTRAKGPCSAPPAAVSMPTRGTTACVLCATKTSSRGKMDGVVHQVGGKAAHLLCHHNRCSPRQTVFLEATVVDPEISSSIQVPLWNDISTLFFLGLSIYIQWY